MTIEKFKAQMLLLALQTAKLLCEIATDDNAKIEPEQVRKNVVTILMLLTETEDFLKDFDQNACSNSTII